VWGDEGEGDRAVGRFAIEFGPERVGGVGIALLECLGALDVGVEAPVVEPVVVGPRRAAEDAQEVGQLDVFHADTADLHLRSC
jgi:hypothetical protein